MTYLEVPTQTLPANPTQEEGKAFAAAWQPIRDEFEAVGLRVFCVDPYLGFTAGDGPSCYLEGGALSVIYRCLQERRQLMEAARSTDTDRR